MNVVRSFDRSFFSVQTSRVAGRLPFFRVEPEFDVFQVAQKLCRSWWHEQKGKVNRQFLGRSEGSMVVEYTSSYTSLRDRSRQVPGSHRNRSTACQSETLPWITKDSGKRWELRTQWPWPPRFIKKHSVRFVRCLCKFKFAGWPVYETLGLETSLKLRFFFQGHQAGLGAVDPIFDGFQHRGHRKI